MMVSESMHPLSCLQHYCSIAGDGKVFTMDVHVPLSPVYLLSVVQVAVVLVLLR